MLLHHYYFYIKCFFYFCTDFLFNFHSALFFNFIYGIFPNDIFILNMSPDLLFKNIHHSGHHSILHTGLTTATKCSQQIPLANNNNAKSTVTKVTNRYFDLAQHGYMLPC